MKTKKFYISSVRTMLLSGGVLFGLAGCILQDHRFASPTTLEAFQGPPLATDLKAPIGLADDVKGNVWVTEAGTATANDGQVTVITPSGAKYPVITGFVSVLSPEKSPEGLNHLLYKDGKLYILHGPDEKLYIVDVSGFVPGVTAPIDATTLTGFDIGTFVRNKHPNKPDAEDSNPYNLTFGPNGDLFIADAGANAIIRRNKTSGELSIYSVLPDYPNPTYPDAPDGPPTIDAVPNGIVFDGNDFYVSTLSGYPFPDGVAKIYKISGSEPAPVAPQAYKSGFSAMTDVAFSPGGNLMVTEFGFNGKGRVASGEDAGATLFPGAITPVDIHLSTAQADTYYLLYYGPGLILKLSATN
jgi:hypothetical protein